MNASTCIRSVVATLVFVSIVSSLLLGGSATVSAVEPDADTYWLTLTQCESISSGIVWTERLQSTSTASQSITLSSALGQFATAQELDKVKALQAQIDQLLSLGLTVLNPFENRLESVVYVATKSDESELALETLLAHWQSNGLAEYGHGPPLVYTRAEGIESESANTTLPNLAFEALGIGAVPQKFRQIMDGERLDATNSVVVFIVDGGINPRNSRVNSRLPCESWLSARVFNYSDCKDLCNKSSKCNENETHGTAIASILVGQDKATDVLGLAPRTFVVAVVVDHVTTRLDNGKEEVALKYMSVCEALTGIAAFVRNKGIKRPIVNLSFSQDESAEDNGPMAQAIAELSCAGCLVVSSAGDKYTDPTLLKKTMPAKFKGAKEHPGACVGIGGLEMVDGRWKAAGFSNRSSVVDFAVPAKDILVSPWDSAKSVYPDTGISYAVPCFCACAALVWERWPEKTAKDVVQALVCSVEDDSNRLSDFPSPDPEKTVQVIDLAGLNWE